MGYLYDGEETEDKDAIAMGITLEKAVYDEYIETAPSQENFKELENGVSYTEEDGTTDYFYTVGSDAYFMVSVAADEDGDAICARISAVPEAAEAAE